VRRQPTRSRVTARAIAKRDDRLSVAAVALQTSAGLFGLILILLLTSPILISP
jgi:hypothetical protein